MSKQGIEIFKEPKYFVNSKNHTYKFHKKILFVDVWVWYGEFTNEYGMTFSCNISWASVRDMTPVQYKEAA